MDFISALNLLSESKHVPATEIRTGVQAKETVQPHIHVENQLRSKCHLSIKRYFWKVHEMNKLIWENI